MSASTKTKTYVPDEAHHAQLAKIVDFMAAREQAGHEPADPRYFLAGADIGDRVELTRDVYTILRQVVDAMERGLAVTITPTNHVLTTQQVADLLGVSRPTVIKVLDRGEIPHERVGTHRRVRLVDVLEYHERRRAAQYAALEATADYEIDDDPQHARELLREARRAVSARRQR